MLVVQHRSKFCHSEEEYEAEKHVQYTFMIDPDMGNKITQLRPYFLRWFLDGVVMYMRHRFTQLPPQVEEWKTQLVKSQDTVAAFVAERLVKTGDESHHVQRAILYREYTEAFPEERNKKTALGKNKWFEQMQRHLGSDHKAGFHDMKRVCVDGKKVSRHDVWLGWQGVSGD